MYNLIVMNFINKHCAFIFYLQLIFSLNSCSLKYQRDVKIEDVVPQLAFEEIKLIQYEDNKKSLELQSKNYEQYQGSGMHFAKDAIVALYDSEQNQTSTAKANLIGADPQNQVYELFNGIEFLDNNQNIYISGDSLRWNANTEQLVSVKNQEITIKRDDLEITGSDFSASAVSNTFLFSGPVKGQQVLVSENEDEQNETITFSGDSMQGSMSTSKNSGKKSSTILSGNAKVKTSTMEIFADSIELSGDDFSIIKASGNVKGKNSESELEFSAQALEYNQNTKIVVFTGGVELEDKKNNVNAKAQLIEYNQNSDVAIMQIDVELKQKTNVCTAAYAIYRKNEQTLDLSGNATVKQESDTFRAQSIKFDMETEEIQMDGNIRGSVTSQ